VAYGTWLKGAENIVPHGNLNLLLRLYLPDDIRVPNVPYPKVLLPISFNLVKFFFLATVSLDATDRHTVTVFYTVFANTFPAGAGEVAIF
jgi:hypothetical protein